MEHQPNEEPTPRFKIETPDGTEYECTPENTSVFTHKNEPEYDLLFIQQESIDGETEGICFWREAVGNFDQVTNWMKDHEFPYFEAELVANAIKNAYHAYKQERESEQVVATVKDNDPDVHLTPRQSRRVDFLGYLLEHALLSPNDFGNENEAVI